MDLAQRAGIVRQPGRYVARLRWTCRKPVAARAVAIPASNKTNTMRIIRPPPFRSALLGTVATDENLQGSKPY